MLEILHGGAETTIQDLGRVGRYRFGICPSGAQDNYSYRVGNILLHNREGAAALEITAVGPRIRMGTDTWIAVTGADIPAKLNGQEVERWKTIKVTAGDLITFGVARSGCRAYMCVAGGIDVQSVFGSRSTGTLNKIGGFEGRKLKEGDFLKVSRPELPLEELKGYALPEAFIPEFHRCPTVRMIPGMFDYRLDKESRRRFFDTEWKVTPRANRVAYYLEGVQFGFIPVKQPFGAGDHPSNVIDIPYPVGSVQVPGGQYAVLLLNDAVTGGGFATIGAIPRSDLDLVAQLKPGDGIRFKKAGIREALNLRAEKEGKITEIKRLVGYPF